MAEKKKPAADIRMARVQIHLHNHEAKCFTSKGPLVHGSVVELPADEAGVLVERNCARYTEAVEARIEPVVNVEGEYVDTD